jgi:hypothetical protein
MTAGLASAKMSAASLKPLLWISMLGPIGGPQGWTIAPTQLLIMRRLIAQYRLLCLAESGA